MPAPTITVEDGTGMTNANSYVAVADVTAYAVNLGDQYGWVGQAAADQAAAVIKAAVYLQNETRFMYRGKKASYAQRMAWPRTGASEYRGPTIPINVVPWRLKDAQCELAMRALAGTDLQPDLDRGGKIQSENIQGAVSTTYMADAPGETLLASVMGLLQPLLRQKTASDLKPFFTAPTVPASLQDGAFDIPGLPSFDKS